MKKSSANNKKRSNNGDAKGAGHEDTPAVDEAVAAFLCEALENEVGGVQIYETAVRCAQNSDLKKEWKKYLDETREHVEVYEELCRDLGVDPEGQPPGRAVVTHLGESLVAAMEMAEANGDPREAEIVAAECVTIAETKCHLNWELVGELAKKAKGEEGKFLKEAFDQVEDEEDEHLYHTQGWTRELWIRRLGMPAVLPPPEEEKDVKTAIGAAKAKKARKTMVQGSRR